MSWLWGEDTALLEGREMGGATMGIRLVPQKLETELPWLSQTTRRNTPEGLKSLRHGDLCLLRYSPSVRNGTGLDVHKQTEEDMWSTQWDFSHPGRKVTW